MPPVTALRQPDPSAPAWFDAPLGRQLIRAEQRQAIPTLTSLLGVAGLYLRPCASAPEELSGNMLHRVMRLYRHDSGFAGDLRCADEQIPVLRDSLSLVYALHVLESAAQPRHLLAELVRVLAPEGYLIVIALNPYSAWRLRWKGAGLGALSVGCCRRWLQELDMDLMLQQPLGPAWPALRSAKRHRGPSQAFGAAASLLLARKRRTTLTPLQKPLPAAGRGPAVALAPQMRGA